jgi:hypothetical protein
VAGGLTAVGLAAAFFVAGPALAVGTGGVDLSPDPAVTASGRTITAWHVPKDAGNAVTQRYRLRNLTNRPVTVHLYAAAVTRSASGAYAVAGPGSATWIEFPDRTVTLKPADDERGSFVVRRDKAPRAKGTVYGALVVEKATQSVATRAATLVYLEGGGGSQRGWWAVAVAAALAAMVAVGLVVTRRSAQR